VHAGATLRFSTESTAAIELGSSEDRSASAPELWLDQDTLTLPVRSSAYFIKVFARIKEPDCLESASFEHLYEVRPSYDGAAEQPDSLAVPMSAPEIVGWATDYQEPIDYGTDIDEKFQTPELALGPALGDALDIVALGNGGVFTLSFDPPIANGEGADFAVFENSFSDTFLELGYVEVSSNGTDFVRFDSAYLGEDEVAAFGNHEAASIAGLAGKHRQGFGTPFDLDLLRYRPAVQRSLVDLSAIRHVRIVDIVGDGSERDAFGAPIYDPTPTAGSAGFDLEAIAVFQQDL
jgi:hypothetical protein